MLADTTLPRTETFNEIAEKLRSVQHKGRYVDTPFRVDEDLEKIGETGKKCLELFKAKSGQFVHIDPKKDFTRFSPLPGDIVYPSCSGGFNRSQTLHTLLDKYSNAITVLPPHATRYGFDPFNGKVNWHVNKTKEQEPDQFSEWAQTQRSGLSANSAKGTRFGFDHFKDLYDVTNPTKEDLLRIQKYYDEHYFGPNSVVSNQKSQRRVYITFAQNAHVIINRLNQTNQDLSNVVVVSIDLEDHVQHPLDPTVVRKTKAAYEGFAQILQGLIDFSCLETKQL